MIQQNRKSFCIKELINTRIKLSETHFSLNYIKSECFQIFSIKIHLYIKHYISWYSILKSIPIEWIKILNENISVPLGNEFCSLLCCSKGIIKLNTLNTKFIDNNVCSSQCYDSKGKLGCVLATLT